MASTIIAKDKLTFWEARWGKPHEGIDIAAHRGAHILASNGVIVYSGNELGGYGNIIVIAHKGGF